MRAAVSSELTASNMASSSSGSALQEILADRQLFESQFGISFDEALLDSDESDLEVEVWEDDDQQSEDDQDSDDDQTGTMFDDGIFYIEALLINNCKLQTCMFTDDDGSANFVHDGNCMIHVESLETSKSLH